MKNQPAFLFFFLLITTCAKAQSNFKEGTIITLKGDTVKGYIDFKGWDLNPAKIKFKETGSEVQSQFTPNDISGFTIKDIVEYHAFNVNISQGYTSLSNASVGRVNRKTKDATVFLKLIDDGKNVKLFSYSDGIKSRFYTLTSSDKIPQELHYVVYYPKSRTSDIIVNYIFRGQLLTIAQKVNVISEKIQQKINSAEYKLSDLRNIINLINGEQNLIQDKPKRNKKSKRIFFGASLNKITSSYSGEHEFEGAATQNSYTPKVSIGIDIPSFPAIERLILRGEFSVTSFQTNLMINKTFAVSGYTTTHTYNQILTSFAPQLLYNFYNTPNFKLYAGAGISINYAFYSKNTYTTTDAYFSRKSATPPELYNVNIMLPIRLGINIKKNIELYSIYHTPATPGRNVNYDISSRSVGAGMNYQF